jgi:hypothetical protein
MIEETNKSNTNNLVDENQSVSSNELNESNLQINTEQVKKQSFIQLELSDLNESKFTIADNKMIEHTNKLLTTETSSEVIGFDYDKKNIQPKLLKVILFCKFLPMILTTFIYIYSLKGCTDPFYICCNTFEREIMYPILIPLQFVCSSLYFIQILIIKNMIKNSNKPTTKLLYLLPISLYIFMISIDRGVNFYSHGLYNLLLFTSCTIGLLIGEQIFYCMVSLIKKHKILLFSLFGVILLTYIYLYSKYDKEIKDSCSDWSQGLKNSHISNIGSSCIVTPPKVCLMTLMNGVFNYSRIFNSTCQNTDHGNYDLINEVICDKSAKIIGFPRTNNWNYAVDAGREMFNYKVRNEIINMEDKNIPNDIKEDIEVTVDFYETPAKLKINLKKNKTLAEVRDKISKKEENINNNVLSKNILTLYIDSVSRADFRRKLPKTLKFIEKYYKSGKDEELESFQFLKTHGVGRFTLLNNVPAFWGTYSLKTEYGKFFLESYKQKGFVTANAQNHCAKETVASDDIKSIHYSNYDHELNGFFCDPNNENVNNTFSNFHGTNSMTPRCLYGKHTGEHNMEYALQFFRAYKDNSKYFHLGLMDNHEFTTEGINMLDSHIIDFLNQFDKEGFLSDTTIIFQTDHGHSHFSFYNVVKSEDHEKELVLPALYLIIPKKQFKDFELLRENLIHNENSMVTPFTIYNSYQALVGHDKTNIAQFSIYNIFKHKIPKTINCSQFYDKDYFKIAEYLCRCEGLVEGEK